jgi:hypothetical protein
MKTPLILDAVLLAGGRIALPYMLSAMLTGTALTRQIFKI